MVIVLKTVMAPSRSLSWDLPGDRDGCTPGNGSWAKWRRSLGFGRRGRGIHYSTASASSGGSGSGSLRIQFSQAV